MAGLFLFHRRCLQGLVSAAALGLSALFPAAAQTQRPTVAVLPLENSSGDAAQNFFAEGMTDEIAAALSGARRIDVVARSSSFRLKEPKGDVKAAGEQLHARYLVQGAARLVGDRVRLNLALLQASDGKQIWAEEYYAESPNIFDMEEDAAEKIAAALKAPVAAGDMLVRSRTDFDNYL